MTITSPALVLVLAIGVLFAGGIYLMLERSLTRILLGFILVSNGANLLLLTSGGHAGEAPVVGNAPTSQMTDPLVQAFVLTSIVITLALTAFVVALAYRSWQLHGHDEVQDDLEDRRLSRRVALAAKTAAAPDDESDESDESDGLDAEALAAKDEIRGGGK